MYFKRGFLRRQNAFDGGSTDAARSRRVKGPQLYNLPELYSTEVLKDPDAGPQKFAGVFEDPSLGYWKQNPNDSITRFQPATIQSMGPHVLLNLDLGSNAMNGESGREKIPMWITIDQIDMLNELVGPPPPGGVEAADNAGIKWGKVLAGPNLGGPRRDGEGVIWEIRNVQGQGAGLFALRDVEVGELVINERPIQIMPTAFPYSINGEKVVSRNDWYTFPHERRDESQKARFESLFNAKEVVNLGNYENTVGGQTSTLLEGITRTNRIGFRYFDDVSHHYTVVYGSISRLNNSCGANVGWNFNNGTFSAEVRAFRKISAGEELTASYGDELKATAARREWLSQRYQFTCHCEWCSLEGAEAEKSDICREELAKWHASRPRVSTEKAGAVGTRQELIDDIATEIERLQAEGLHCYLRDIYLDLALASTAFSDREKAKEYALLYLEILGGFKGTPGSDKGMSELEVIAGSPERHALWGTSSPQSS